MQTIDFVITDEALASLPAAGIVSNDAHRRAADGVPFPQKKSQKSPSYTAPSAIALACVDHGALPTARMKLTPSLRGHAYPFIHSVVGGIRLHSFSMQYEILLLSRESVTCFTSPLFQPTVRHRPRELSLLRSLQSFCRFPSVCRARR